MCGIAGLLGCKQSEMTLSTMLGVIKHRGPDAQYEFHDDGFSFGINRLAINDIENGKQPFFNRNNDVVCVFNGEIYNHRELRVDLERRGIKFATDADGEVLPHLYEIYGISFLDMLDGMFGIAIWDRRQRALYLGRDAAGEKPLYFFRTNDNKMGFASTVGPLVKAFSSELSFDLQAIWDFPSFLWVPEPRTTYSEIKAVPRGHWMRFAIGEPVRCKSFETSIPLDLPENPTDLQLLECIQETVSTAVKARLISDAPVGALLSGGLDSGIVSALASKDLDAFQTFTVALDVARDKTIDSYDESDAASLTAKLIGSKHQNVRLSQGEFRSLLGDFCTYADQPFGVSSGLGVMAVSKAAHAAGVKVLLTGDGADETFGGYSWYQYLDALPGISSKNDENGPVKPFGNSTLPVNQRLASMSHLSARERAWAWHYYASENDKRQLFSSDLTDQISSSLYVFERVPSNPSPIDYIKHDRDFYLPNEMMRKLDLMTMAHSVEGRAPLVSRRVLALAEHLRFDHMVRGERLKVMLRDAFEHVLPNSIVGRPKKSFVVPIEKWLKNDWRDLVLDSLASDSQLAKHGMIASNATDVATRMLSDSDRKNGHTLFCMVMLNLWLDSHQPAS